MKIGRTISNVAKTGSVVYAGLCIGNSPMYKNNAKELEKQINCGYLTGNTEQVKQYACTLHDNATSSRVLILFSSHLDFRAPDNVEGLFVDISHETVRSCRRYDSRDHAEREFSIDDNCM